MHAFFYPNLNKSQTLKPESLFCIQMDKGIILNDGKWGYLQEFGQADLSNIAALIFALQKVKAYLAAAWLEVLYARNH